MTGSDTPHDALAPADAAAFDAWRALAEKTLKGTPLASLVSRTADGLPIEPLYAPGMTRAAPLDWGARDLDRPWDARTLVAHPDAAGMNAQAMSDLEGGGHSILLVLDPEGRTGLAARGADDLARALQGVETDLAPVALDAGFQGIDAARWLSAAAKGGPAAPLAFHLDPLSAFARAGTSPGPMADWIAAAAKTARELHDIHPRASLFLASGSVVHEAGGTEAQELAFALASALTYAKALEGAGLPRAEALSRIVLGLSADARPLVTIAKLRAARVLWSKLTTALGAGLGASGRARIEARGSLRMLSTLDAWVNLIRLTAAGFGAACGGADAVVLQPFTAPLAQLPADLARRQARNTQLVLMEEAGLGRVADPGEGAGVIEALTDGLARAAWDAFQAIETSGGALAALQAGAFQAAVAEARRKLDVETAKRKTPLVGVTDFADLAGAATPGEPWPKAAPAPAPRLPGADDACAALAPHRVAEPFEALRAHAPSGAAVLATLGAPKSYAGRLGFARTLLAVGGIASEPAAIETAQAGRLVVLCGADADYAEHAADAARALKRKGAGQVWLAGRPGENEAAFRAAGIDGFLYAGGDALADLTALQGALA
jgi:methylmalonyl-CoA mutase